MAKFSFQCSFIAIAMSVTNPSQCQTLAKVKASASSTNKKRKLATGAIVVNLEAEQAPAVAAAVVAAAGSVPETVTTQKMWFHSVISACVDVARQNNLLDTATETAFDSASSINDIQKLHQRKQVLRQKLVGNFINVAFQLAWTANVTISGKPFKLWSTTREALRLLTHDAASKAVASWAAPTATEPDDATMLVIDGAGAKAKASGADDAAVAEAETMAINLLLQACACATSDALDQTEVGTNSDLAALVDSHATALGAFVAKEGRRAVKMRASCMSAVQGVLDDMDPDRQSPEVILHFLFDALYAQVPMDWFRLAALAADATGAQSVPVFGNAASAKQFAANHVLYLLNMMSMTCVGEESPITSAITRAGFEKITAILSSKAMLAEMQAVGIMISKEPSHATRG